MNTETIEEVESLFTYLLETRLRPDHYVWLQAQATQIQSSGDLKQLSRAFAQVPRYASKDLLGWKDKAIMDIKMLVPGYDLSGWTVETFCRVWLLKQLPFRKQDSYVKSIDTLFAGAEFNELVALYKAFPLLQYPMHWLSRCEEGIRSNIGNVLEAIMYHNPYPSAYLSESAWNQMVLKAFFTDKDVTRIYRLQERVNPALKATLADYIQERLAAGRSVNPELYKLMEV
jgi:hypothetical protein